jgi:hypothetical protein
MADDTDSLKHTSGGAESMLQNMSDAEDRMKLTYVRWYRQETAKKVSDYAVRMVYITGRRDTEQRTIQGNIRRRREIKVVGMYVG